MTGAILKLQYKKVGQDDLSGNITGCFFFVCKNTIATCNHVLNKNSFRPDKPFNHCIYFLLMEKQAIMITDEMISEFPEVDLTFVHLKKEYSITPPIFSKNITPLSLIVRSEAYNTQNASFISIGWEKDIPIIKSFDLEKIKIEYSGYITNRAELNWEKPNAQGMHFKNAKCLEVNYGGPTGASGSALFSSKTNEIIGMVSGGEKLGSNSVKHFFAISSIEIAERIKQIGLTKPFWKFW